jgi:ubiquinone/menaquinone biosynthesis C-methylase UbiE
MPDVYATIQEVAHEVQERLAEVLELRAADPEQRRILETYLQDIVFEPETRVLEVGCGTGAVTRVLAGWPGVREAVGVDPSPVFVAKARELAETLNNVSFEEADGRALPFPDDAFDLAVFHTSLTHIPQPERALAQAFRVLRPSGTLAIYDGDYSTISVALGEHDPLQSCIEAVKAALINDLWLVRRLPALLQAADFEIQAFRSLGYVQTARPDYLLTLVDRGADTLAASGRIGTALAAAIKAEGRRRAESGQFFGFIANASFVARKPG